MHFYCEECGSILKGDVCANRECTKFEKFKSLKSLRNQIIIKLCLFF
jgi:hypothetical protein